MAKTILLAEDSHDDEILFDYLLRQSGLANPALVVRDGEEVIAYLGGTRQFANREKYPLPEVLFLNLKMPKVDGFEVLQWIKTQTQIKIPLVIVLSHLGATKEIDRAYDLAAHSFLTKPLAQMDLNNLVRHFHGPWMFSSSEQSQQSIPH